VKEEVGEAAGVAEAAGAAGAAASISVEFVRVEYDVERAMRGIRESDLPDDFADYLRTGGA
jgi:hypothetical protein